MINRTCEQSNISSSPQCSHRFILQFRLICQSIVNLQNSFFGVIYICLKFCSLDKLCIVVFFNSTKSFLKPFNHLTILTIFSDYANFLACFCIFCMRWCFHFIPLFVRDQMLSSWKGQCFYHQYILCTFVQHSLFGIESHNIVFHQSFSKFSCIWHLHCCFGDSPERTFLRRKLQNVEKRNLSSSFSQLSR